MASGRVKSPRVNHVHRLRDTRLRLPISLHTHTHTHACESVMSTGTVPAAARRPATARRKRASSAPHRAASGDRAALRSIRYTYELTAQGPGVSSHG